MMMKTDDISATMARLKRLTLLMPALLFMAIHALAVLPPTSPDPLSPANGAVKVDINNPLIHWSMATAQDGGPVTYDLYLGTSPAPPLFRSGLYADWVNTDYTEYVFSTTSGGETYLEFFSLVPYLSHSTIYYWKVVARDGSGGETHSSVFSFTTGRENPYPSSPVVTFPAAGTSDIPHQLTLEWTASVDPDGDPVTYNVYLGTGVSFQPLLAGNITTPSYTVPFALDDQQTYYWRVLAIDAYDGAAIGSVTPSSFTVENYINDAPTPPALARPLNGATNTGNSVRLSWSGSTDKDGDAITYDVYVDRNTTPVTRVAEGLTSTYYDLYLEGAHTYYWKVVARDGKGKETTSAVFSFTTWSQAPSLSFEMVSVEGGTFTMGQSDVDKILFGVQESTGAPIYLDVTDEHPAHTVTVSSFRMARYEVTNTQFAEFLNAIKADTRIDDSFGLQAHPNRGFYYQDVYFAEGALCQVFDATQTREVGYERYNDAPIIWDGTSFSVDPVFANHPVRFLYYPGAHHFAQWAGYELPTEAEWEYAALGGKLSHGYAYSGSNVLADVAAERNPAHYFATQPIGSKQPNELGLYDMSGNVAEICTDRYDPAGYTEQLPATNPVAPSIDALWGHTFRGGIDHIQSRVKGRAYHGDSHIESAGIRLVKRTIPFKTITGIIRRPGGRLRKVKLRGLPIEVTSDMFGSYFAALPAGWNGTITPELSGYRFTPESIAVGNLRYDATFNFTATLAEERSISGVIVDNSGQPLANVVLTGGVSSVTTAADGSFTIPVYKGWAGTITPQLDGYTFDPPARQLPPVNSNIANAGFTATHVGTHTISGKLTDDAGHSLAGVMLSGLPAEVATGPDGTYSIAVTAGWTGTITPVLEGYDFTPPNRTITNVQADQANVDFSGTYTGDYVITGTIEDAQGSPLAGVTVTAPGLPPVTTDAAGAYVLSVPAGWTGMLTPALEGYQFTPESITIASVHTSLLNQDFTGASTITSAEEDLEASIHLFPNPSRDGKFRLRADGPDVTVGVFDRLGSKVNVIVTALSGGDYEVTLISAYKGLYMVIVTVDGRSFVRKLVVN